MSERLAVFAYGSLVYRASAAATFGREVRVLTARLRGFKRRFSQARDNRTCEKTFARIDDGSVPRWILGLNVERCEDEELWPNGALIELSREELRRLDQREIRYDQLDVTDLIDAPEANRLAAAVTYVAKPAHLAPEPPDGAVILRSYAEAVEAAFEALGPGEAERYRQTTLPYPGELIDGRLIRDEIPAGNPRDW